jgi:4-hydroxy-tetrahydrodipicolinate synthase
MTIFKGSGTAIVTPFYADHTINFDAFKNLIEFQIQNGTNALIVCGTTGEASTLADDEHIECIRFAAHTVNGRIPVIAGAGSNHTDHGVNLCAKAQKAGADALLLVTPYYNKTTQRGLIEHYGLMAKATDLPVMVYNVPARTGMNILPSTMKELCKIDNIVATKEASGEMQQIGEIAALCGGRIGIYSGNDGDNLPILSLGGLGVVSVLSNIAPKNVSDMCALYFEGKTADAISLQIKGAPVVKALFSEVSPVPVKEALNQMGLSAGPCRRPLTTIDPVNRELLAKALMEYGLI